MHLWPSERLRDSFKHNYLKNLEWNLQRMNSQKKNKNNNQSPSQSSNQEKLLGDSNDDKDHDQSPALVVFKELLLILSCCYCCYGCGACSDGEDD